jgi:hypothetical protein
MGRYPIQTRRTPPAANPLFSLGAEKRIWRLALRCSLENKNIVIRPVEGFPPNETAEFNLSHHARSSSQTR